jgi:hypothetical protein
MTTSNIKICLNQCEYTHHETPRKHRKKQPVLDKFRASNAEANNFQKPSLLSRTVILIKNLATEFSSTIRRICNLVCILFCLHTTENLHQDKEKKINAEDMNTNTKTQDRTKEGPLNDSVSPVSLLLSPKERLEEMKTVFDIYEPHYAPIRNRSCLENYITTRDFERHVATAKVYYNNNELSVQDAAQIAFQREPVNITTTQHYDKTKLTRYISDKGFIPHTESAFNTPDQKKTNGEQFKNHPCTVGIYSETFLWSQPGVEDSKIEISCLSIPAPALDSQYQPHYSYYVQNNTLDKNKYAQEMNVLANMVVKAAIENKLSAFQGMGIKRLVIPLYGQGAFLAALVDIDRLEANKLFFAALVKNIISHANSFIGVEIVISEYSNAINSQLQSNFVKPLKAKGLNVGIINGDILQTARERDLIVNAWDPHSIPGNGNDHDGSFDGAMGRSTGIGLTQLAWINPYISKNSNGIPVDLSRYIQLK